MGWIFLKSKLIVIITLLMFFMIGSNEFLINTRVAALEIDPIEVVMFGKADKKSYISSMKSSLYYAEIGGLNYADIEETLSIPVLDKSRTLKKCFTMKRGDVLVIPAGKTLTLTGGADIAGTIYIEEGGKLLLERFSVTLTGSILCDGELSVTGGTLLCGSYSLLYIGENGSFTATDRGGDEDELNGRIDSLVGANVICFGETNIPDPTFAAQPIAAVYQRIDFAGAKKKTEIVADVECLLPSAVGFNSNFEYSEGAFYDNYTILFSGGSSVIFSAEGTIDKGWSSINGTDIRIPLAALKVYAERKKKPD